MRSCDYQRLLALLEPPRRVGQHRINVFGLQVGVGLQNPLTRLAAGQQAEDGTDRNAQPTDARLAAHDGRIVGNSLNVHDTSPSIRVRSRQQRQSIVSRILGEGYAAQAAGRRGYSPNRSRGMVLEGRRSYVRAPLRIY